MTLMLELPTDVEADLAAKAKRQGVPLQEYALRLLSTSVRGHAPQTGTEVVEYWRREGLLGSRTDIADSRQHARMLRESAGRRERV